MSHRVVLTRQRTIEEKAGVNVNAPDPNEAINAAKNLVENGLVEWGYSKTIDISDTSAEIHGIKSK